MAVTFLNDKELKKYDEFYDLIQDIIKYFEDAKDYSGFPTLPNSYTKLIDLYNESDKDEKRFMFCYLFTSLKTTRLRNVGSNFVTSILRSTVFLFLRVQITCLDFVDLSFNRRSCDMQKRLSRKSKIAKPT